jgi:arylsulfatase A-like enzyme
VWQENLPVPLVVSAPGAKPRRVEGWVQQNALGGTVAELAGIGVSPGWKGGSLAAVVKGAALTPGYVHSVMKGWRVVIDPAGKKLVAHADGNRLYDLAADPDERTDVAAKYPDDLKRLQGWLRERRAMTDAVAATLSKPVVEQASAEDAERKKQLEALGYTE